MRNRKALFYEIMNLGWPTMLEQLLQTAVQYIDTAMVGSLGTLATAAVGSTSTVNWLIMGTMSGFGVGFIALISQSLGAGKEEKAREVSGQSVLMSAAVGLVMTIFMLALAGVIPVWMQTPPEVQPAASLYFAILSSVLLFRVQITIFGTVLRAAGDTQTPMKAGFLINLINILLNVILIYPAHEVFGLPVFGAGLGIMGAALASACSFIVGGMLMTWKLYTHPQVSFARQSLKPNWTILQAWWKISLPGIAQRIITSSGYVVFASMINSLGAVAAAAHTIANTVESAFYIPGWGMQAAAAALAGNAVGAGNTLRLQELKKMIVQIELVLMIFSGGLLFVLANPFMHLFSQDPQVIALGTTVLKMVALSEPFYGVPIVLEGIMMGQGKTLIPFLFNITGMWLIRIAGTYVCTQLLHGSLISAWACMIAHNLFLFAAFILYSWYENHRH